MFRAIRIDKDDAGYRAALADIDEGDLPPGDVTVAVDYSTLNYKDALAITGAAPIVRLFPFVPGIDFAGTVTQSQSPRFKPGDQVLLNGFGVGEGHWGGLAGMARVKSDWLIPLPKGLSAKDAMALGTAGYTAMLAVMALQSHGVTPDQGEVLVTGAAGGVGSVAVRLLHGLGFRVAASTGRPAETAYLKALGAAEIIDRGELSSPSTRPLVKSRWAAVIDNAGSHILANALAAVKDDGVAIACGNAQGLDFSGSVAPFILRAVTLVGINSVNRPLAVREAAWARLAREVDRETLDRITRTITLDEALALAPTLLAGGVRGRVVVSLTDALPPSDPAAPAAV